uniref:Uncharacterized protein n=1 Tax=Solanum lycopersicum TaxID=4081 RepID=A0A3Q7HTR5_SOLLC
MKHNYSQAIFYSSTSVSSLTRIPLETERVTITLADKSHQNVHTSPERSCFHRTSDCPIPNNYASYSRSIKSRGVKSHVLYQSSKLWFMEK